MQHLGLRDPDHYDDAGHYDQPGIDDRDDLEHEQLVVYRDQYDHSGCYDYDDDPCSLWRRTV